MLVPPNWLTPSKNKKHPWGHVGAAPQLALLTCFILMCFLKGQATRIGASHVWNWFITNCLEGRQRKLDGAAQKMGRQCAHLIRLPASLSASGFQGAGRQAGGTHKGILEDTEFSSLKISLQISERDQRRGLNWFLLPKPGFLEFIWIFSGRRSHFKNQYLPQSEIPLNPAHQDLSNNTKATFQFLLNFQLQFNLIFSEEIIQYSRTFAPQVQTPWNQAHATPSLSRAFQRHQEHHLKHPCLVDLITTKQNKTKQTTFLHRWIYIIRRFWHMIWWSFCRVMWSLNKHHGLNQHRRDDLILQLHSGPCSRNWMINFDVIPFLSNVVMSSLMHTLRFWTHFEFCIPLGLPPSPPIKSCKLENTASSGDTVPIFPTVFCSENQTSTETNT